MPALTLGSVGVEMNLVIRQGATFGPHVFTMKNPNGSLVDLTGATISARMKRRASDAAHTAFSVDITPLAGEYTLSMTAAVTAALSAGGTLTSPDGAYVWDMEMTDATGRVIPLYYGKVNVFQNI